MSEFDAEMVDFLIKTFYTDYKQLSSHPKLQQLYWKSLLSKMNKAFPRKHLTKEIVVNKLEEIQKEYQEFCGDQTLDVDAMRQYFGHKLIYKRRQRRVLKPVDKSRQSHLVNLSNQDTEMPRRGLRSRQDVKEASPQKSPVQRESSQNVDLYVEWKRTLKRQLELDHAKMGPIVIE